MLEFGCSTNGDCADTNVCTTDTCVAGACQYANNAASCNDGLDCTSDDICGGGACAGTSNCPSGQSCSAQSGVCEGTGSISFNASENDFQFTDDINIVQLEPHITWDPTTAGHDSFHAYAFGSEFYFTNLTDNAQIWKVLTDNTLRITPATTVAANVTIDGGTGSFGVIVDGSTGGAVIAKDTDDAGWTECVALNGVLTCGIDANGIPDGTP